MNRSVLWRVALFLAGAFILIGGPQHPGGTMEQMLADPRWVPGHAAITVGFAAFLAALVLHRRSVPLTRRAARWTTFAIWGTAFQILEMVVHTAAAVDHGRLVAGEPTPVLMTHLALSLVAYPAFGITVIGWILATARDRLAGSRWIAWLGVLGAVAHGAAPPLVVGLDVPGARVLFPMVMLFALWCVLAAFWPRAAEAVSPARGSA